MKSIQLTRGQVAIVDDEDFEWLSKWKWHYNPRQYTGPGYAERSAINPITKRNSTICMHRAIMGFPKGKLIDHKNGNGLDNTRSNLRLATFSENSRHRKYPSTSTTGLKGVHRSSKNKYRARIRMGGKLVSLGTFTNPEDAREAYLKKAKPLHGEFIYL